MTSCFEHLRRIVALSVAITLFVTPIASAQSSVAVPPSVALNDTALLNPAAFARLAQLPSAHVAPAPAVTDPPRPSLLRQATAATAREAQTAPAKAPEQKSWASRHKGAVAAIIVGAFIGLLLIPVIREGTS